MMMVMMLLLVVMKMVMMVMLLLLMVMKMVMMMVMVLLIGSDEPLSCSACGRCSSGSRPNLQHAVQPVTAPPPIHRAVTTVASPTPA